MIKQLANNEIDLEVALSRLMIIASDINNEELYKWAESELNGYIYKRPLKLVLYYLKQIKKLLIAEIKSVVGSICLYRSCQDYSPIFKSYSNFTLIINC